jgi:hypothetical protein
MRQTAVLALACVIATTAQSQVVTDVALPPGLPTVVGAPFGPTPLSIHDVVIFAEHDALAFVDGVNVRKWTGLPSAPAYASFALAPAQKLVAGWKVARDVLLFWSVGADLTPNTGDEKLCMVRGMPYAPTVVTTSISPTPGLGLYPFFEVGPGVAASINPSGFQVVVHGPAGATLTNVPVAGGLQPFGGGRVDAGTVAAYAGGNNLVVLRGLAGPPPYSVQTTTIPGVTSLISFTMSEDGVGIGVTWTSMPTVTVYAVQIPPATGPLTVTPFTLTGPTSSVCSFACWTYLYRVAGGGAMIEMTDDGGRGFFVIGNLRGAPVVRWQSGYLFANDQFEWPLSEDEILSTMVYQTPGAFTYTRVVPGGTQSTTSPPLADHEHRGFVRLGRGAFAYLWRSVSGITARITVMRDALGANAASTSSINGMITRAFSLGGAAVAAFVDTSGTSGIVSPSTLRIVSAARASVEALANPVAAPPIAMTLTPSLGSLAQGLTISLQTNPAWAGTASLYLTSSREPLGQTWAGVDGLVHLVLPAYLADFPIAVNGAGFGQIGAPPGTLPPWLAGVPLYVQAAVFGGGVWHLSDMGMIVLG